MKRLLYILLLLVGGFSLIGQPISHNGSIVSHQDQKVSVWPIATHGSEMVSNGTFSNGSTGWLLADEWTVAGDTAAFDNTDYGNISQSGSNMVTNTVAETDYRLEFDISISSGVASIWILNSGSNQVYVATDDYGNGHHIIDFTTPASVGTGGILFYVFQPNTDNPFGLDNVSLKEEL